MAKAIISTMEGVHLDPVCGTTNEILGSDEQRRTDRVLDYPQTLDVIQLVESSRQVPKKRKLHQTIQDHHHESDADPRQQSDQSFHQESVIVSSSALLNRAPYEGGEDVERVSTGTKYAMALWLTGT